MLGTIIKQAITIRGKIPARKNVHKQQIKQLNKLLSKAQFTSFGEHHGFMDILLSQDPIL